MPTEEAYTLFNYANRLPNRVFAPPLTLVLFDDNG